MSFQDPILIVGCPRSGTSLTAGIIDICGAFGGQLRPADGRNQKGYFENERLAPYFNDAIMQHNRISKLEALLEPGKEVAFDVERTRAYVAHILKCEGYKDGPWYFKYPNALNNPSVMAKVFPDAKWVVVKREEEDIRASATDEFFTVRSFKKIDPVQHFLTALEQVKDVAPEHIEIWPFDVLAQGADAFKPLIEGLGLAWNEQGVKAFADRSLVHHDSQRQLART